MTLAPTDPAYKGKPTREEAKAVWDAMPNAGARTVAKKLVADGYDISWRSIARWHAVDWRPGVGTGGSVPLAEKGAVKGVNVAVRREMATAGLEDAVAGTSTPAAELLLIEARRQELMLMSESQLDQAAAKARIVYNILLMEQAARRAHIMVLIPKETASLVDSLTEANKVGLSGKDGQPPSADDLRTIEGTVNREPEPVNETADAIRKFRSAQAA